MAEDRDGNHGYRSIWYVMLGGDKREPTEDEHRTIYLKALATVQSNENKLQFADSKLEKDHMSGGEVYDKILDQYGFGPTQTTIVTKKKKKLQGHHHQKHHRHQKHRSLKEKAASLEKEDHIPTSLPEPSDGQEEDFHKDSDGNDSGNDSDTVEPMPESFFRAEVTVSKKFTRGVGEKSYDGLPEAFLRRIRTSLLARHVDMSIKQIATYRAIFQRMLKFVESPMASLDTAVMTRAEFEAYVWSHVSNEKARYDRIFRDEKTVRDVLLGSWNYRTIADFDVSRPKVFFVYSDNKTSLEKTSLEKTTKKRTRIHSARMQHAPTVTSPRNKTVQTQKFSPGAPIMVQEEGEIFRLWDRLDRKLGKKLLSLSNAGHATKIDSDADAIMSFPGFCALQASFCSGNDESLQLLMSLMSTDAFIAKHDWLQDLIDNAILRDLKPGLCADCSCCAPAKVTTTTNDDQAASCCYY